MSLTEKYDRVVTGVIAGILFPVLTAIIVFLFTHRHGSPENYILRILDAGIMTHAISLCVFPNIIVFLIFNRLDMLKALRGVLAVTIIWALIVFAIKFIG